MAGKNHYAIANSIGCRTPRKAIPLQKSPKPLPFTNKPQKQRLQKIDEILADFRNSKALQKGFKKLEVAAVWKQVMGANVAALTEQVSLQGDVLRVKLQSSLLREELRFGTAKIVSEMNATLGAAVVREIRWG